MPISIHPELQLDGATRVALVSDVHLGDGSSGDLFGHKDDLFIRVLQREVAQADVLVINGDAVDHLYAQGGRTGGSHDRVNEKIERAHGRVLAAIRTLSRQLPVYYVLGNHEHTAALRHLLPGLRFVSALTVGAELCVTHGHQFDLHWNGAARGHLLAALHARLEALFRMPIRQPFRDYDNPLNRVVHRLFFFYTQAIKARGVLGRWLGSSEALQHWQRVDNFWARGQWGDLSCLFQSAVSYLEREAPWRTLVLGHSHQPGVVPLGPYTYANLGSWALAQATYGRIVDGRVEVRDALTDRPYGAERYRELLSGEPLPDMAEWFRRYYRGLFRYDLEAIERDFPREAFADDGVSSGSPSPPRRAELRRRGASSERPAPSAPPGYADRAVVTPPAPEEATGEVVGAAEGPAALDSGT
jgi:UDP-2,3-diacylglucosamine pyrophosphatase LpxH